MNTSGNPHEMNPNPPSAPMPAAGSGYPTTYAPYAQYGYYGQGGGSPQDNQLGGERTLRDYLMIVRERMWYLILSIFVFAAGTVLWHQTTTPEYRATAKFKIERHRAQVTPNLASDSLGDRDRIADDRDFQTQISSMQSTKIIRRVSARMTQDEMEMAQAPYRTDIFGGTLSSEEIIAKCVSIQPQRQTLMAIVQYTHPDRYLAQKITNYFVEEIIRDKEESVGKVTDPMLEKLKIQLDQMKRDLDALNREKNELIQREKILTWVRESSTVSGELSQISTQHENDKRAYEDAKANWDQLVATKAEGKSIVSLPFVARDERVVGMQTEIARLEIGLSSLLKKYTDLHPSVGEVRRQLEQAQAELAKAVASAEAKLSAAYRATEASYQNSAKRLAEKQSEMAKLRTVYSIYESMEREIKNRDDLYQLLQRTYEVKKAERSGLSDTQITLIDTASYSDRPINKNLPLYTVIGLFAGTAIGLSIIFLLALLDDRVKSASDIENLVGIPLIGVVPKVPGRDACKKARSVSTNADRATTESFHAIYSALKIHDQARKARVILTTSTTPGEGKSFFTTNMAATLAMHGERVIVVDGDLRLPNVGKSLQLEGDRGLVRYQSGEITLDQAIHKNVLPGLDVLPVGIACKNPTQVLNSKRFISMIDELRGRYDRVFIDSPPVGAVADALNLMPHVDGAIYVVKFNAVKRKNIIGNLRRLRESKVPVFGAVLNQMVLSVADYYTSTYDKAYNRYYHDSDPNAVEVKV